MRRSDRIDWPAALDGVIAKGRGNLSADDWRFVASMNAWLADRAPTARQSKYLADLHQRCTGAALPINGGRLKGRTPR